MESTTHGKDFSPLQSTSAECPPPMANAVSHQQRPVSVSPYFQQRTSGPVDPPTKLYPIFTKERRWKAPTVWKSPFHVYSEDDIAKARTNREREYRRLWNSIGEEPAMQSRTRDQMQEEVNERWRKIKATIPTVTPTVTPTTITNSATVTSTTGCGTSTTTVTITTTVTTVTVTPLLDQLPKLRAQLVPDKEQFVEKNLQRYFENPDELEKVVETIRRRYVKKGITSTFVKYQIKKLTVS